MSKKFIIAWIVIFVAWFLGSFVVHGVVLRSDYMQLTNLFRPEGDQQKYFPLMILAHVILSGALVWIYARGAEPKPGWRRVCASGSLSHCSRPYRPT